MQETYQGAERRENIARSRRTAREQAQRRYAADRGKLRAARSRRRNRSRREPVPPGMFPKRFSEHRIRIVSMLRRWQRASFRPKKAETHSVRTLIGQLARGEVYPTSLPDFVLERERRARLLGYMVVACFVRAAAAVTGSREEWGELLGCCARTAWSQRSWPVDWPARC